MQKSKLCEEICKVTLSWNKKCIGEIGKTSDE